VNPLAFVTFGQWKHKYSLDYISGVVNHHCLPSATQSDARAFDENVALFGWIIQHTVRFHTKWTVNGVWVHDVCMVQKICVQTGFILIHYIQTAINQDSKMSKSGHLQN